jgi:nitrogen fixation uncharacterized protein
MPKKAVPKTAKDFIKALHTNKKLRDEVHGVAEGIAAVAKAHGYKATREEISDALKKHWVTNTNPTDIRAQCAVKFSEAPGF